MVDLSIAMLNYQRVSLLCNTSLTTSAGEVTSHITMVSRPHFGIPLDPWNDETLRNRKEIEGLLIEPEDLEI